MWMKTIMYRGKSVLYIKVNELIMLELVFQNRTENTIDYRIESETPFRFIIENNRRFSTY